MRPLSLSDRLTEPLRDDYRFDGKVVLVTGASAGCGLAIAQAFARHKARVILLARAAAALESAASDIRAQGGDVGVASCDVTDPISVRREITALPRLDVLINNAGTNIPEPFLEVSVAHLQALTRLNLRAAFLVAQAAINKMRARDDLAREGGAIINISSQMGHIGAPERVVYCMTKHGLEGLTKALAIELAPENIRVNSVAPTFVDTPLIRRIVNTDDKRSALTSRIPMGRMASADDVASAALYLASPAAGMVTGASLLVDGGWCAC
jgi:NAD(P)-dependent dehydrogenase (short-subunit alcohol dehydrogenase family)